MVVIRCTQRLLKRSRVTPDPTPPEPTAILGEWYANVMALPFRGESAVIFCNVETRLVVITLGSTLRTTMPQFAERLERLLERLGVPPDAIALQREQMVDGTITTTDDRTMLGVVNEAAHLIRASAERFQAMDSLDIDHEEEKLAGRAQGDSGVIPTVALARRFRSAGFHMHPVDGVLHELSGETPSGAHVRPSPVPPQAHRPVPKRAVSPEPQLDVTPVIIVATLTVRRELTERFREFEMNAVRIMGKYGGSLERSVVEEQADGETFREVHVLRFPSSHAYDAWRIDAERLQLSADRADLIVSTEIIVGHEGPSYDS